MKEATKEELKEVFSLKRIMWVLIGNTIYSCGIAAFVLPNDLITGGTTGIALILEHYFGLPIGLSVAIFNIVMFILAILILGKSFALTALISTFYFPWILSQFQKVQFIQNMTDDFLLGSIFAGLMLGLGVGLVIRAGASTGGMDIPPLILNKKFGLPVSIGLYVFDFTILIIQMSFRDKERILYGILLVLIYSTLVDKVLLMGKTQMQVKSDKSLVKVKVGEKTIETGLKKFGAMLGDEVEVGCGSVLNPGSVIGSHTNIYPLSMVRGVIPAGSIYKKQGEIVAKQ